MCPERTGRRGEKMSRNNPTATAIIVARTTQTAWLIEIQDAFKGFLEIVHHMQDGVRIIAPSPAMCERLVALLTSTCVPHEVRRVYI